VKKSWIVAAVGAASLVAAALATGLPAASAVSAKLHPAHVCKAVVAKGEATCHALKMVNDKGVAPAAVAPPASGLDPTELKSAYKLTGLSGGGRTVAIVDAYGYTNLERDLNVYRSQFGMTACTQANGCLRIIDQNGGTALPRMDLGWAQEQALDVDAVSAACPDCKILVVQAKTPSFTNLGIAVGNGQVSNNAAASLAAARTVLPRRKRGGPACRRQPLRPAVWPEADAGSESRRRGISEVVMKDCHAIFWPRTIKRESPNSCVRYAWISASSIARQSTGSSWKARRSS